tara:strand:- start:1688 stop:3502 length:1815 start_codon:yes stop_codon:yes gene_type:complete
MATVTKTYSLIVDVEDKEVEQLNKNLEKTEEGIEGIEEAGDKMTGGLVSGFKAAKKGVTGMIAGLKTMKGAIIATGLGAFVIVVTSLMQAFTSTEEGQNQLAKGMAVLGAVVDVFTDRLAAFGRGLISLFTDPVETFKGFGKSIKEFVMDKVDKVVEGLGFMGKAISKLFKGDFSGALEDAGSGLIKLNQGLNPAVILTEALVKSTKDLIVEITKEGKIAAQIADQRAKAEKLDRQLLVDRAKANRDRAELLEKAVDKEKFTTSERIEFLKEAGALEDEITKKEIQAAQLRLDAQIAENALGDSNKEALEKEVQLRAQLINLETAKLTKAKEVTGQIIALNAEEAAAKKAIDDKKIADDKIAEDEAKTKADELKTLQQQIRDAEAVSEDDRRALEIQKTIEHYDNLIALAKAQGLATEGLLKAKGAAVAKFSEDESKVEVKWADMTQEEKLDLAKDGLNNMATILGEESAAGKAAAIAAATISTFQSAQSSYQSLAGIPIIGPVLGAAAAGAAIVSGMAQVKAITATKLPTLGGKTPPAVTGGSAGAPPLPKPPSFNTVGASDTNQLASAIGQQEQQPVQAYVVSNDVTTAQGLERNIVQGATL